MSEETTNNIEDDDIYVRKMGRPQHEPSAITIGVVTALKRAGLDDEYIAHEIQVSPKTLTKYYGELLRSIKGDTKAAVKGALLYNALVKKDFKSQAFYLQTQHADEFSLNKAEDANNQYINDAIVHLADKLPD